MGNLKCQVPSDDDAAVRVSQILQLARLVQASQNTVSINLLSHHLASVAGASEKQCLLCY